ncbi:MAG TPA: hypothetical protein VFX21_01845 [Acidimicrobiia bacterium]|nr:hypothetical protein [Acidimicrobiia bacterium]
MRDGLPRLVLVDGLPGSGKTTTAERMCRRLRSRGIDAAWAAETAPDHPVFPRGFAKSRREPEFPQQCLDAWAAFVDTIGTRTWVLDGAAFQSTVRFFYDERVPYDEIFAYWRAFETIVMPLRPTIFYLRDDNPADRMRTITIPVRGRAWYDKVSNYVARTPAGREFRHLGVEGFIAFWVRYGELCESLLAQTRLDVASSPLGLAPEPALVSDDA